MPPNMTEQMLQAKSINEGFLNNHDACARLSTMANTNNLVTYVDVLPKMDAV